MTQQAAAAFIARVESDEEFALALDALKSDPNQVLALIRAEGFELEPEEVRDAFFEHYGSQLSEEDLAAIAGGLSSDATNGIIVGSIAAGIAISVGASAAAAA